MKKSALLMGIILLLSGGMVLSASEKWINIHVEEADDDTKVDVRVPVALLAVALDCLHTEQIKDGKLKLDMHQLDVDVDFKRIWDELRKYDNTEFVRVESSKENVYVARQGDLMVVRVLEKRNDDAVEEASMTALIKIPVRLVDAVLSSQNHELDLKALIAELDNLPSGDLVEVQDRETHVRIWIE
ncbi:MAG: hypothetical protein JXQ27_06420 [Acidobacteria bacterium]|nr:hypothetical protein [Acidobacteriota bacterium]